MNDHSDAQNYPRCIYKNNGEFDPQWRAGLDIAAIFTRSKCYAAVESYSRDTWRGLWRP